MFEAKVALEIIMIKKNIEKEEKRVFSVCWQQDAFKGFSEFIGKPTG